MAAFVLPENLAQQVNVELAYRSTEIVLSIVDNGPARTERRRQRAGGDDGFGILGMRERASGFLLKDVDPAELRRAVHVVAAGDALLTPNITRRLIDRYARQPAEPELPPAAVATLTERETEILGLVGRGLTNDDIAVHLRLSQATVKTHVSRAMTKLGAHDRAQLVIVAHEHGLVRPGGRDLTP